ncbi:MAG: hypothetical protein Q9165_007714 [Trypethelium subeluteriae]
MDSKAEPMAERQEVEFSVEDVALEQLGYQRGSPSDMLLERTQRSICAMGAVNNFVFANFILGMANLSHPEYTIERWHTVLVAYALAFFTFGINMFGPSLLDKISKANLIWNIGSFLVIVIVILACNDHKQSATFVFKDFQNFSGFNPAYAAIIGTIQSAFGMCCYDAPAHMTEEMLRPRKQAPQAIVLSVWLGAITGLIFLIACCFCIGDIETTASSTTGVPLIQIFYDSTGSVPAACVLVSLIVIVDVVCGNMLLAEGSRSIYAFARDDGLPFSTFFSKVNPKLQIPINAMTLTLFVQIVLNSIYFGTLTGFDTVITIATEGFYVSYAMPLFARVVSRLIGQKHDLEGPWSLGRYGLPLNVVGLLFLLYAIISFNFPSLYPVTSENMNYTSAAVGVIMFISLVTWITTGRKHYTGPGKHSAVGSCCAQVPSKE